MSEEKKLPEIDLESVETDSARTAKISQGLNGEQFDYADPVFEGEAEDDLSGIEISYDLREEEVKKALKAFQRKVIFKKNLLYTAALAVLGILYAVSVIRNPNYTAGYILGGLSIVIMGVIWYLPSRHVRLTAKAVGEADDHFFIEVCERGFLIREGEGKYLVDYQKPLVSVIELPDVFVICVTKEKVFAIPKRCIDPEKMDEVVSLMKTGLGEKYEIAEQK
jgi:hypothetical protein